MDGAGEVVRAALEGRLGELCRACLTAPATTPLSAECGLRTGAAAPATLALRDVLARVTGSQIAEEPLLPRGLCDACLASCLAAFRFSVECERTAAALRRSVDAVCRRAERHGARGPLLLAVRPRLADYCATACDAEERRWEAEAEPLLHHCSMCARSFTAHALLCTHERAHPAGTDHICRQCGRLYKHRAALRRHAAGKHGALTFPCAACGRHYASAVGLNNHRASQHPPPGSCAQAQPERVTDEAKEGKSERRARKGSGERVMCEVCAATFPRRTELNRHVASKHTQLQCPVCGKSFKVRSYYEAHVRRHGRSAEELKVHRCEYCPYATGKKFLLTCHTRRRHTHVRPYSCELCGKGFYIRREVKLHMVVHTRERPEACAQCDKRFVNKTALLFHTRLHTGERPYPCPHCAERFLSTSRRGAHVRSKHGLRPQCAVCHSTFTDKHVLRKHLLNVHGRKPDTTPDTTVPPPPLPAATPTR